MHHLHTIDYSIIIVYLVLTTVIGMVLTRRASKSLDHYFLGNRSLPWWLLGIAGMSNWFDLTGTMIITSFLYMLGPRGLYIEFRGGAVLILAFLLAFTGKWHRRSGCMTGAEWLTYRFGNLKSVEVVRVIKAVVQILVTIALLAYLVRGTSLFLGIVIPYPPATMTIILIALTTLYTMCAGFYGVVVTDLIQGVIIIISCLVISFMAWSMVPNTHDLAATAQAVTGNAEWGDSLPAWHTSMPKGYEAYQSLILIASFYLLRNILGGLGTGDENRYFGARDDRSCGLQSFLQGITVMFRWPLMIGFAVMGIYLVNQMYPDGKVVTECCGLIHAHYPNIQPSLWHDLTSSIAAAPQNYAPALIDGLKNSLGPEWTSKLPLIGEKGTINPEQILPAVLMNKIPMGLAGLLIVAMIAAMKGSLAGMVNGTSAFFVKDIYQTVVRPKASNRELIAASWLSTVGVMAAGLVIGLTADNINSLWSWFIMSLTAGGLAPALLRLYWWRCNGWGFAGGLLLGVVGAVLQKSYDEHMLHTIHFLQQLLGPLGVTLSPLMAEPIQFILMTGLSFLGTIGGSLLTAPTPLATLRNFYHTTRPFGLWAPLWKELTAEQKRVWGKEHRNDILTVPFAMLWQITLFLLPMQLVIKSYDSFFKTLPFFLVGAAGMYWFWWRNLDTPGIKANEMIEVGAKS